MKKSLLPLFFLLIGFLSANSLTPDQIALAKQAALNDLSLLNSPQAQEFLKRGSSNTSSLDSVDVVAPKQESIKNDINTSDIDIKFVKNKKEFNAKRLSPLEYKSNEELLNEIKSIQLFQSDKKLQRFSTEFFRNKNKINKNHIAVAPDYVLSKGDTLVFWIYGSTNRNFALKINAQGNINIPQIGPVHVAGEKFKDVKELLTNYLTSSYQNSEVVVDLNAFSTIQVTLTGFVNAPGIYNTSSVSSIKNLLIESKGVSSVGSVRNIYLKRGGKVIKKIDFYHLLKSGLDNGDEVLHPNDTIHIPKAYGLVKIRGAVNKEAIYEIEKGESLAKILKFAGDLKPEANRAIIQIKRYLNNNQIRYLQIPLNRSSSFILKDGDEIFVERLSNLDEKYVSIFGNVISEGKKAFTTDYINLSTLLKSQMKNNKLDSFFLPNTLFNYALIKRINQDLSTEVFSIDLTSVLEGRSDFKLRSKDEIYIFNKLDISQNPFVTIEGKPLLSNGKFQYYDGLSVKDLINLAGVASRYDKTNIRIVSYSEFDLKPKVSIIDIDKNPNFKLKPFDSVYVYDFFETNPIDQVHIIGEVIKPGSYIIEDGMSLSDIIKSAGGLKESAYAMSCEVIRYEIKNGERKKKIFNVDLKNSDNFIVQKYDEINIKKVPGWSERKSVTITGEVKFPGTYVIHSGEKLSSVIKRAGGFTKNAFLYGAVFKRESVAKLQQKALQRSLSKLKEQIILASLRGQSNKSAKPIDIASTTAAVEALINEAKDITPIGRVSINLTHDLDKFICSSSDLTLMDKDELFIPTYNDTVLVHGEVLNPTALPYISSDVRDYIKQSGGLSEVADEDHIYVIHANGMAEKASVGSFFKLSSVKVKRGDTIIVPKKLVFESGFDLAQGIADIIYKLSLTIAAAKTVGAL